MKQYSTSLVYLENNILRLFSYIVEARSEEEALGKAILQIENELIKSKLLLKVVLEID